MNGYGDHMNAPVKARLSVKKSSQVMLLLVFALVVLILFLGLAIDLGFAYLTKATLSKSVDSAALIGALNLGQGTAVATSLATNMFYENYHVSARDSTNPVVNVTFTNNATQGTTYINVNASATIKTFFISILPQWKSLTVSSSAQGTRSRAIICLILDRSGSMKDNGGAKAMSGAVTNFISCFDDDRDEIAMVSFATTPAVDVQMPTAFPPQAFRSAITTAVKSLFPSQAGGATFSQGGLTNALVQIAQAPVNTGENVLKAVVFFTDGYANTIQDTLNVVSGLKSCSPPKLLNFGGYDSPNTVVGFFSPTLAETATAQDDEYGHIKDNETLRDSTCKSCPDLIPACTNVSQFYSQTNHAAANFTQANVSADAEWRARQVADAMRSNKVVVYSIGLGSNLNKTFLKQIANDPTTPGYVKTDYDGEALFAPSSAELAAIFQAVARKIALRLTQ